MLREYVKVSNFKIRLTNKNDKNKKVNKLSDLLGWKKVNTLFESK